MKYRFSALGLACAVSLSAVPAHAGVSADFSGCDGLKKPKSKDDGMRGEATMSSFRVENPRATIDSCTRALARKQLKENQKLRRAHLLRARAAAYIQVSQPADAIADLDAAEAVLGDYIGEYFFDRSMGVSLKLLRAMALNDLDQPDEARQLAIQASEQRPYAVQIQTVSAALRDMTAKEGASAEDRAAPWVELGKISPGARAIAERRMQAGQPSDALFKSQVEEAGDEPLSLSDSPQSMKLLRGDYTGALVDWVEGYDDGLSLAYAFAATGDADGARGRMDEVQAAIDAIQSAAKGEGKNAFTENNAAIFNGYNERALEPKRNLIRARIALLEGKPEEVAPILSDQVYPATAIARDLYAAYEVEQQAAPDTLGPLTPLGPEPKRQIASVKQMASSLLIRPEDARKRIDYQKSRPDVLGGLLAGVFTMGISFLGGFDRTQGFKSEALEDGSIKVEYTGETTLGPVVQEMTLLRAAEMAREAGKSHFTVNDRKDYGVYWGNSFERTLTGYKTVLEIAYLDQAEGNASALDAVAVIDALGPIYYKSDEAKK
ncbi:MAG: hypothetical protein AAF687_04465 [Pseudomonadota bacterium]